MNRTKVSESRLPVLISFSGIDGAGKSTQIEKLCGRLADAGLSVKQLAFWDNVVLLARWRAGFSHKFLDSEGGIGVPDKPVHRNDKNVRAWYLNFVRLGLYLLDALSLRRAVAGARKEEGAVVVFDRYIYDQLATLPLENRVTRTYVQLILAIVPAPDVAYLLDADPEEARKRKPEYPVDFLCQYRSTYLRLQQSAGLTLILPQTIDEVHDTIVRKFESVSGLRIVQQDFRDMISA
jgi:thymidylate kinase